LVARGKRATVTRVGLNTSRQLNKIVGEEERGKSDMADSMMEKSGILQKYWIESRWECGVWRLQIEAEFNEMKVWC
jgi:hypothetical protein